MPTASDCSKYSGSPALATLVCKQSREGTNIASKSRKTVLRPTLRHTSLCTSCCNLLCCLCTSSNLCSTEHVLP